MNSYIGCIGCAKCLSETGNRKRCRRILSDLLGAVPAFWGVLQLLIFPWGGLGVCLPASVDPKQRVSSPYAFAYAPPLLFLCTHPAPVLGPVFPFFLYCFAEKGCGLSPYVAQSQCAALACRFPGRPCSM